MKNVFAFILVSLLVSACAGNPPAWWNPGNRYGGSPAQAASQTPATPVVKEEPIDMTDESYEEIAITPMPDEDNENATGVAASQNEELLPAANALPQPSVLE